ncbi:MAG: AraC family transcriptional regulator [bacterium]|nr:AraC family transcriptional regulator [bacterium]
MNAIAMVFIPGAAQGIFLSAILVSRKLNTTANRALALLLFMLSLELLWDVYYVTGLYRELPELIGANFGFAYLYGPLIYLYTRFVCSKGMGFKKNNLLHFVPFVLVFVYCLPVILDSGAGKLAFLARMQESISMDIYLMDRFKPMHGLIYMGLSFLLLRQHRKRVRDCFSNITHISLIWLRNLLIINTVVWIVILIIYIFELFKATWLFDDIGFFISFFITVGIYAIGYLGLRQPEIFSQENWGVAAGDQKPEVPPDIRETAGSDDGACRYEKSGLDADKANQQFQFLLKLMEEGQVFRNPDLSLKDIAHQLGVSSHNLSEIINTRAGKNFYDFVNHYRVEEVKTLLLNPEKDHLTILALALDAGFNSKSSFNAIFKKHTGTTPTAFKKGGHQKIAIGLPRVSR